VLPTRSRSGDARRAAHSSVRSDPVFGSSRLRRFARTRYRTDRDTSSEPGLPRAHTRSVPIDVHGSPDRVKDVSSFARALIRRLHDECVRNVSPHADHVPLLLLPEGTCCHRCDRLRGNEPRAHAIRTDLDPRCSANPRRLTASRGSGCLPPKRPRDVPGIGPSLTPPTRSPHGWGQGALDGHCKHGDMEPCRHLVAPCVATPREQDAFMTSLGGVFSPCPGGHAPGTDDPSAPTGLDPRGL